MKAELKGTTLHIIAEPGDQWTGKTIALRIEDGMVVCGEVKAKGGKKVLLRIRTEGKPAEFLAAVDQWQAYQDLEASKTQAARDQAKARDQALLAAMEQEAARLRSLIPAGHIEVIASEIARADGDPIYRYDADEVEIPLAHRAKMVHHGWASAIRPGAMASFKAIQVCSISREDLDEIQGKVAKAEEKKQAEKKAEEDRIAAAFAQARETGERVALRTYMIECDDSREECSWDAATAWAMPDGTERETKIHTW